MKKYSAVELENDKVLFTNPFVYEGKTIFLRARFEQMMTATTGWFHTRGGEAVVTDVPRAALTEPTLVIMAAQVLGKIKERGVFALHLKLVGMEKCAGESCPF